MRGTEENNSNRSRGATNVGEDAGEEEKVPDSRENSPILVAEDAHLPRNCPALLRQLEKQLSAVTHYKIELGSKKPSLTTEDTEALHTWQLLQEMRNGIFKLAKDTDAAFRTCVVKLQALHQRVVDDLYHPDVLKMKTREAIARKICKCKPKLNEFNEAMRTFKNLELLSNTQKDLQTAQLDVGADWAKNAMKCNENLVKITSEKSQRKKDHMEKKTNDLLKLFRQMENLNLEEKTQNLEFLVKKLKMVEQNETVFQGLSYEALRDYVQESETKTRHYTTGFWFWESYHTETVENPQKEEKKRKKECFKKEKQQYEDKHQKLNEEIAKAKNELAAAQREAAQIEKNIADLAHQREKESEMIESAFDMAIKDAEKECKSLHAAKRIFGPVTKLMDVLEIMNRLQLLSIQGDNMHGFLCQMLENISSRFSDWVEAMEDLAEDPRDDDRLDEVRIARDYIANPNAPHPNPFLDMETEPENAGKKLLEY